MLEVIIVIVLFVIFVFIGLGLSIFGTIIYVIEKFFDTEENN